MFDEVTKREGGRRAARKGAYLAGSTAFQVAFIAALVFASERIRAHIQEGPVVDVKFVKSATPPPPPPPPAPPRRKSAPKPPSSPDAPKPKPPPPQAMIQPKEVQEEIKLPDPGQKPEPEPDYGDEGGDGDGVVGGVVGGAAAAGGGGGGGIEEAPVYAGGAGYASAREKERGCVGRAVRVPRELAGIVSAVTAKFAVRPGGRITDFTLLGNVPDKRIEQAVWNAIQECDWVVATDPTGKAVSMWVMLPLRFTSG